MVVEAVGGFVSGSLALLADAGHMLSDAASLLFAWYAFRLGRRPPSVQHSYGMGRAQVLVAFGNGLAMLFVVAAVLYQAVERLLSPSPVQGPLMLGVAVVGLGVNLVCLWVLAGGDRHNLNMKGALLHVAGDALGSIAAIVAGLLVIWTGSTLADPVLSILVCGLLLRSALRIVQDSGRILLEATPQDVDAEALRAALRDHPDIVELADLHVWCLTEEQRIVTLHAEIPAEAEPEAVQARLRELLRARFSIDHATLELRRNDSGERCVLSSVAETSP